MNVLHTFNEYQMSWDEEIHGENQYFSIRWWIYYYNHYNNKKSYPGSHGKIRLAKSNGVFLPVKCKAAAIDMMIHKLCKCAGYAPFRMLFCNFKNDEIHNLFSFVNEN